MEQLEEAGFLSKQKLFAGAFPGNPSDKSDLQDEGTEGTSETDEPPLALVSEDL
jgi:hypothetical protein